VREQVERLEHDPDPLADAVDVDARRGDLGAADDDPSGIDGLEQVDAAEQRGLAGARGADEADHLVLGHHEVDAAQDLEVAERLVKPFDPQCLGGGAVAVYGRIAPGRGLVAQRTAPLAVTADPNPRFASQSTRWMSGTVITTKTSPTAT
jgi:hypothetical protein